MFLCFSPCRLVFPKLKFSTSIIWIATQLEQQFVSIELSLVFDMPIVCQSLEGFVANALILSGISWVALWYVFFHKPGQNCRDIIIFYSSLVK